MKAIKRYKVYTRKKRQIDEKQSKWQTKYDNLGGIEEFNEEMDKYMLKEK